MNKMMIPATIALAALAIAGCSKKAPEELPPPPAGTEDTGTVIDPNAVGTVAVPGSQADFVSRISADRVYFDTDQYNIDGQDQTTLQSQATWLAQYPQVRVTIEGHADERGTRDYNIALGERRANAAKNALSALGVDPSRISTVSYGKERPQSLGSDESAWAQNRRAVTVTVQF